MKTKDFDKQLSDFFKPGIEYNEQKHEEMLRVAKAMYKAKSRRSAILTYISLIISVALILFFFWQFWKTEDIKIMFLMTLLILIFHEVTVLMKLWWWVCSTHNSTMETLKAIQLQIVEMRSGIKNRDNEV